MLSIAGSDTSGGAGIQRDLRVFQQLGADGRSVITALTAQTSTSVAHVELTPLPSLQAQLVAALDGGVDAIKIGMLGSAAAVTCVAAALAALHPRPPIVLDPVMVSSSGRALLHPDAVAMLRDALVPLCTLVTPNRAEAARLGELPVPVLRTGGDDPHAGGDVVDVLLRPGMPALEFRNPRIAASMHGTGCTLSSAIATGLATGHPLPEAIRRAIGYVRASITEEQRVVRPARHDLPGSGNA